MNDSPEMDQEVQEDTNKASRPPEFVFTIIQRYLATYTGLKDFTILQDAVNRSVEIRIKLVKV